MLTSIYRQHVKVLDSELWKFNNNYILLKDYLGDAADRLQDITCSAAQVLYIIHLLTDSFFQFLFVKDIFVKK